MKNVANIQIVKKIAQLPSPLPITLKWPTFLECLDLADLYNHLPSFDAEHPFFQKCLKILFEEGKDQAVDLFDRLFAENLCLVKDLPQLQASFLLEAIEKKESSIDRRLYASWNLYENRLNLHDLILYLGWERMCISVSRLFDAQSAELNFLHNLEVLKECLVESYQHISKDGKTSPSLYRLLEALFFYHMREENLHKLTEEEWSTLSQSFNILKDQNALADFFYIDEEDDATYLTSEPQASINTRLIFADFMIKKELPNLTIDLKSKIIVSLE